MEATQEVSIVEDVDNLDLSSTVLQVPSVIDSSTNISTYLLQQILERKTKRVIQLEAPNLGVVANLVHKGMKVKKIRIDSRLVVNPTLENLFVEIAQPVTKKNINEEDEADFSIINDDLGPTTDGGREHNFQVSGVVVMEQSRRENKAKNQLNYQV